MRSKLVIVLLGCLLSFSSVTAQFVQDPNDLGAADTARMIVSLKPDAVSNQLDVNLDLYCFNDAQRVTSLSLGFFWVNSNLQMTEALWTEDAALAFDFIRFLYRNNNLASTNLYQEFQCVASRLNGPGLIGSSEFKHVASYHFTLSSWSVMDSVVFDTVLVLGAGFAFVDTVNHEYKPYWDGRIVVYDDNRPIISNLVLSDDTLRYATIEGGANPPAQTVTVTSDRDPLSFDVVEDVSWLLKNVSTGVTPQDISFSVTNTGLTAGTYFDSVAIESGGADNSPQFIYVEFELAPPLPEIAVDRDAFFFNALAGGDDPAPQTLQISNAGQSTLNWSIANNESWLTPVPSSGIGDASVALTVSTAGLIFGNYYDTLVISDPQATNSPVRVPVRLSVASDLPVIEVDSVVNLWVASFDERPLIARSFGVRNGGAGTLDFTVETTSTKVINITPAASTAPDSVQLLFYIEPRPAPEPTNPYEVVVPVTVRSNEAINSPVAVSCRLRFVPIPAVMDVSTAAIEFDVYECYQGYGNSMPTATFDVANLGGDDPMVVTVSYESELFEIPGAGAPVEVPASFAVNSLLPDLPPGVYYDTIWVTSPWASNNPRVIEVTFNFLAATEAPLIGVTEGMLAIPYQMESGPQIVNSLEIFNLNPGCMPWSIEETVPWLTPIVTSGQVPDASPLLIDPAGYALGEYPASLEIVAPTAANSPAEIGLALQVWKLRGDVNWNGRISVQDIALLIDYVFNAQHPPQPAELVADVNCDETVDVADIVLIVEYMFSTLEPLCDNPY